MSPDRKWVWDGTAWQPVAAHEAVFPNWNGITVEPAPAAAEVAQPVVEAAPAPPPVPITSYAVPDSAPVSSAPLWQRPETGLNKYLYIGAGVVVLVIGIMVLNSLGSISWPWSPAPASSSPTAAKATPAPVTTRSDYGFATHFEAGLLGPAVSGFNETTPTLKGTCNGILTISCQNAITATDTQLKNVVAVIDHAAVPLCIAAPVARLRVDMVAMDDALQATLTGYNNNRSSEVKQGLYRFNIAYRPLVPDYGAIDRARTSSCDTQVVGP